MKVWLVWRTNVGKSTLFNKLIWTHRSIVTDISWTTRESFSELANIWDVSFLLFDSPWLDTENEKPIIKEILQNCDVVIFMVDAKDWITHKDQEIQEMIFKSWKQKQTLLLINKVEWDSTSIQADEFYQFGFQNIHKVSVLQQIWTDFIKDFIVDQFKTNKLKSYDSQVQSIPLAIVGRPNTWKSTLLNKFAQKEVAKVEDKLWTTLDYLKTYINYKWEDFVLYDTAWIRKKWRTVWLEKIAFSKTYKLLELAQPTTVILLDMQEWLTHTDKTILGKISKLKVPAIIAVNKTDLFSKKSIDNFIKFCTRNIEFAKHIPIIPISSKTWYYIDKILDFAQSIYQENNKKIQTSQLNNILNKAWIHNPPRFPKNKICKFYYATQTDIAPPRFVVFVNDEEKANFSFKKWIENNIRKNFGFIWCFIDIKFKGRS